MNKSLTETESMQARVKGIDIEIAAHQRAVDLLRIEQRELQDMVHAKLAALAARQELEKQAGVIPIAVRAK